jgi:hypothetical protein
MQLPRRGKNRDADMKIFAEQLIKIDDETGFKVSSRGWCYQLEGLNVITKGDFNRVQSLINECRKNGLLPINFVAEESARQFENVWVPTEGTPEENLIEWVQATLNAGDYHNPDYWENEHCSNQYVKNTTFQLLLQKAGHRYPSVQKSQKDLKKWSGPVIHLSFSTAGIMIHLVLGFPIS